MPGVRDPYYVPVEDRWLGLDKRKIPLAVVVVAIMLLMLWVVPAIDEAVEWDDPIEAGDVIDMGGGATFVPPVGWDLLDGIRTSDDVPVNPQSATAQVVDGGVSISVASGQFDGTPDELLDQVERLRTRSTRAEDEHFEVTSDRSTVTTDSGLTGVSETSTSATGDSRTVAFTYDDGGTGYGLVITVDGGEDGLARFADEIDDVLSSISTEGAGS